MDTLEPSWHDVEKFVKACAKEFGEVCGVYAPPRGGLCLGVMLSHAMGVPMLLAPCDGCLIVDDICDGGLTLQHFRETLDCKIATMYYVDGATVTPDYWMYQKVRGDWVLFPWEVQNG